MATPAEPPRPPRTYRYYDLVMAAFVTVLLCANVIGAAKVAEVGGFVFGAGVLFFPISYVFGDVLTEVYGYARARKVVWAGFGALAFASFMSTAILAFPPPRAGPTRQPTRRSSGPPRGSCSPRSSATSAASSATRTSSPG
jgi:queuosine precursor transporter